MHFDIELSRRRYESARDVENARPYRRELVLSHLWRKDLALKVCDEQVGQQCSLRNHIICVEAIGNDIPQMVIVF